MNAVENDVVSIIDTVPVCYAPQCFGSEIKLSFTGNCFIYGAPITAGCKFKEINHV